MINRRKFLAGGAVTAFAGGCCPTCTLAGPPSLSSYGCVVINDPGQMLGAASGVISNDTPIIPHSDDPTFDLKLALNLIDIGKAFGVSPGFAYYDDYDGPNAFASPTPKLGNDFGTVMMGRELLKSLKGFRGSNLSAVLAVCAHEFGHVIQYKRGLLPSLLAGQKTVKRCELQADFFAGFYAGMRKVTDMTYPAAIAALTQHNSGDELFTNPTHHGTPEERGRAVEMGFDAAYSKKLTLDEAVPYSFGYVIGL